MKKKLVLNKKIESVLVSILLLTIGFVAMTIESIGNTTYNKVLLAIVVVDVMIIMILKNFTKDFNI